MKKVTKRDLLNLNRPIRYIGSEFNECIKSNAKVRICIACSNLYEVRTDNRLLNEMYVNLNSSDEIWCERTFLPYKDFIKLMDEEDIGLETLESKDFLKEFDIIIFNVNDVLEYANVLKMLDLSRIDRYFKNRIKDNTVPIIVGVGQAINENPLPISEFMDMFIVGDPEEAVLSIALRYKEFLDLNLPKMEFFRTLKNVQGVYIPSIHDSSTLIYSVTSDVRQVNSLKYIVSNMHENYYKNEEILVDLDEEIIDSGSKIMSIIKLFNEKISKSDEKTVVRFVIGKPGSDYRKLKKITDIVNTITSIFNKMYSITSGKSVEIYFEEFVIMPHTPYEWLKKNSIQDILEIKKFLDENITEKSENIKIIYGDYRLSVLRQVLLFADEKIFTYIEKLTDNGFLFYTDKDFQNVDCILEEDLKKYDDFLKEKDMSFKFSFDNFVFPAKEKIKLKKQYKSFIMENDEGTE